MIDPADVAAVLVTRGNVDLQPIIDSLPYGEVIVWDNSKRRYNLGVMGRYAAIVETTKPWIYTQDDDCIVRRHDWLRAEARPGWLVGIMPEDHALDDTGHTLVGWGAIFQRHLPGEAFAAWLSAGGSIRDLAGGHCDMIFGALTRNRRLLAEREGLWHRTRSQTADEAETAVKVMEYMFGDDRMHHQGGHNERRHRIYTQCLHIREHNTLANYVPDPDPRFWTYGDEDRRV